MNKVIAIGHLTKDVELKTTPNGTSVASFGMAVQRRFKNQEGNYDADFINCVAWRATAEFIAKYFSKGSKIGVVGSLQSRSYEDKDGNKRYITEVVVDEAEFVQGKGGQKEQEEKKSADELFGDDLSDFQPLESADLPF